MSTRDPRAPNRRRARSAICGAVACWLLLSILTAGCGGKAVGGTSSDSPNEQPFPEQCRSQCELAAGTCDAAEPEYFADLDDTRQEWSAANACGAEYLFVVQGQCDEGNDLLYNGTGFTTEVRYFDPTGSFVGLATTTDAVDETCRGRSYWPEPVVCTAPRVSEVLCGQIFEPGDPLSLPWAVPPAE